MHGVMGIALAVDGGLGRRLPEFNVALRRGISQVVAAILTVRGANLVELGNVLPHDTAILLRPIASTAHRQWSTGAWRRASDYRIRLKCNLTLSHDGGEITTGEVLGLAPEGLDLRQPLRHAGGHQHLGASHEQGYPEPWIIAMAAKPARVACLDYGLRWGIEAMFPD